ncbi:MAG: lyase family protein [Gammaproteobacteria bacterium]
MIVRESAQQTPAERALEIGGRLGTRPSEIMVQTVFARELQQQQDLWREMSLVDIAYTLAGIEAQLLPQPAGRELLANLLDLHVRPAGFSLDPERGDLYTNREAWIAERTAAVGWLGAGRARREATTTAFLLQMRSLCAELAAALAELGLVLCRKAGAEQNALMPDYTYLQVAQPTTFGHYLLGFAYSLERDLQRLAGLFERLNRSPMGCGSSNGSRLVPKRMRMAELLAFDGLAVHGRDAMWQADLPIECGAVLTTAGIDMSRLAEDLQIFCSAEFGLVVIDDIHARASKIMPQKKNPFALNHVRSIANESIGTLTTLAALARTPSGQPDNRLAVYGTLPESMRAVRDAALLLAEVIDKLAYNRDRGESILRSSWAMATDLAETFVTRCDLDFRSAHKLVGHLAAKYAGRPMQALDTETVRAASAEILGSPLTIDAATLSQALDAQLALRHRTEPGGAAPESIAAMLGELTASFHSYRKEAETRLERIAAAEQRLLQLATEALPP